MQCYNTRAEPASKSLESSFVRDQSALCASLNMAQHLLFNLAEKHTEQRGKKLSGRGRGINEHRAVIILHQQGFVCSHPSLKICLHTEIQTHHVRDYRFITSGRECKGEKSGIVSLGPPGVTPKSGTHQTLSPAKWENFGCLATAK